MEHSNVGVGEMVDHSNVGVGEMVDILATLESEKWWSLRNIGVGEMVNILATLELETWWIAVGVGEMVKHNHDVGCSKIGGL